ncbi:MAG TPA: lipoate--protein ligase family protein [Firmicutes bacterium]|nr:lipoate--protein ligase family protein [Bacillota bacterium]
MPDSWRVIIHGASPGCVNMAIDEAILICHAKGFSPPTLRFYGWAPPALSLGYAQVASKVVDFKSCASLGVDLVRRPTGGRAVLHEDEVTYSVVVASALVPGTVEQTYLKFSTALTSALRALGVPATIAPRARGLALRHSSSLCFEAASSYEILVNGKKLVGSAQTRRYGCILQHGSIVMSMDYSKLEAVVKDGGAGLRNRATSIEEAIGRRLRREELIGQLIVAFKEAVCGEVHEGDLEPEERCLAHELRLKYADVEWGRLKENTRRMP